MGFIHVLEYIMGLAVFGFTFWLLDGIKVEIQIGTGVTGDVFDFMTYVWFGSIIIYLLFGGIWLVRSYAEIKEHGG